MNAPNYTPMPGHKCQACHEDFTFDATESNALSQYPFLVCGPDKKRGQTPISDVPLCIHAHNGTCTGLKQYCKVFCPGGTTLPVPKQYFFPKEFAPTGRYDPSE